MKSKHIIVLMAMALPTLGLQSCLDYDNPGDEFNSTTKNVEKVTSRGDVDKIPFRQATDAAAADEALNAMQDLLDAGVGGQFSMRGGRTVRTLVHMLISISILSVLTTMLSTRLFLILSSSIQRFVWHRHMLSTRSAMVVHGVHSQR